jgi:hypothetical protein
MLLRYVVRPSLWLHAAGGTRAECDILEPAMAGETEAAGCAWRTGITLLPGELEFLEKTH